MSAFNQDGIRSLDFKTHPKISLENLRHLAKKSPRKHFDRPSQIKNTISEPEFDFIL